MLRYQGGVVFYNDIPMNELPGPTYTLSQTEPPIAVLTNELTNSAGELVAIALRARPNTRSFGQRTNGLTTAPRGFVLSDGAALGVSTSYFADITGETYPEGIIPDDVIPGRGDPLFRDPAVPQEAIDWLLGQPPCGGG
jgi:C-terminal processing protease CtpA/Prc